MYFIFNFLSIKMKLKKVPKVDLLNYLPHIIVEYLNRLFHICYHDFLEPF